MNIFFDIHCHVVPNIDDGSASLTESIAMAKTAMLDGTTSMIATPHQLGTNRHVSVEAILDGVSKLQSALCKNEIPVSIRPGADVRIDPELPKILKHGKVLTLADRGKHVLLELPHDTYYPIDQLLKALRKQGLVGILSHPERNRGIIKNPDVMWDVIEAGGLLQITAASLTGSFGLSCQEIAELAVDEGLIHFIASDAHNTEHRPFGMREAYDTICDMGGEKLADLVCCENPSRVFEGDDVKGGLVGKTARRSTQKRVKKQKKGFGFGWFDH
ncbi:MAG TPA: tyrosine protein phosphatase [Planctomycetaceae bacterium]|nr:tyrosine protein phosphatase [Planctomycetaceae bacterium]|tara:strand:+ start:985 stop:1803 length:819 start_codon:yes stop_codon:yes gene_type:complete